MKLSTLLRLTSATLECCRRRSGNWFRARAIGAVLAVVALGAGGASAQLLGEDTLDDVTVVPVEEQGVVEVQPAPAVARTFGVASTAQDETVIEPLLVSSLTVSLSQNTAGYGVIFFKAGFQAGAFDSVAWASNMAAGDNFLHVTFPAPVAVGTVDLRCPGNCQGTVSIWGYPAQ